MTQRGMLAVCRHGAFSEPDAPLAAHNGPANERESAVRWFRLDLRVPADRMLADYDRWLERQALATRTRTPYRRWVGELVAYLDAGDELVAFLTPDGEHGRAGLGAAYQAAFGGRCCW